ncbi:glycosyltransferase family 2 protein [Symbiopectobacterium sp. RP]|uniref:glycosyltransferase family 2 protein n=1 Tax=Symbiopectobacterium sp. RP TaxID=3248553 RepID=UPI003D270943
MEKPLISVIIPVFNAENYIKEAVESIIQQSYTNIEIIIINDGSVDGTSEILNKLNDSRIKIYERYNKGLVYTLNELVQCAKGKYIARMDADDISMPNRLEEQVKYLECGFDIVGSNLVKIDNNNQTIGYSKYPLTQDEIMSYIPFNSPFSHPTVMAKRWVYELKYKDEYFMAEDYALWLEAIFFNGAKVLNIEAPLLNYRIHKNSVSRKNMYAQLEKACDVRRKYITDHIIENTYGNAKKFVFRGKKNNVIGFFIDGLKYLKVKPDFFRTKLFFKIMIMQMRSFYKS